MTRRGEEEERKRGREEERGKREVLGTFSKKHAHAGEWCFKFEKSIDVKKRKKDKKKKERR